MYYKPLKYVDSQCTLFDEVRVGGEKPGLRHRSSSLRATNLGCVWNLPQPQVRFPVRIARIDDIQKWVKITSILEACRRVDDIWQVRSKSTSWNHFWHLYTTPSLTTLVPTTSGGAHLPRAQKPPRAYRDTKWSRIEIRMKSFSSVFLKIIFLFFIFLMNLYFFAFLIFALLSQPAYNYVGWGS